MGCGCLMTEAETVNTFEKQLTKVLCPEFPLGGERNLCGVGDVGKKVFTGKKNISKIHSIQLGRDNCYT